MGGRSTADGTAPADGPYLASGTDDVESATCSRQ